MKGESGVKKVVLLLLPLVFIHAQTAGSSGLNRVITASRLPSLSNRATAASAPSALVQKKVLPRILSDGNWETTIILFNTGSASVAFQLFFFAADGRPAAYKIQAPGASGEITSSAIQGILPTGSNLRLALSDTTDAIREGWSILSYDDGPGAADGYAIIRHRGLAAGFNSEIAETFSSMRDYSVYTPFDNTLGFRSHVTLVNPAANLSTQVRLTYLDPQGQVLLTDSLTLWPGQQMTLVLPDTYPDLANKSGSVLVESDIDRFSVTALRSNEVYGTIATLPIMNRSVLLPQ